MPGSSAASRRCWWKAGIARWASGLAAPPATAPSTFRTPIPTEPISPASTSRCASPAPAPTRLRGRAQRWCDSWCNQGGGGPQAMEVEMKIRGLMMDPVTNMPIVILKDINGNTVLPIWVGVYEANAIALEIEKVSTPRPMTHDLIKTLLLGLDTGVRKVVISELQDDTFYAVIWLDRNGELISVDSRPSDALALALRLDCPIYVEETVLKSSKLAATVSDKVNNEELRRWLEGLNDEDMGRYKM